ncbi:MAG TPA: sulfotransferase [Anaerolineales bacterium]|nr:sulfotransferase [Anaerolineales bacterium]
MVQDPDSKFVVFTTNRSGSEWVMSTLNNYEDVSAHSELFLPRVRDLNNKWDAEFAYPRFIERKVEGLQIRPFSVSSYLNTLYNHPGKVGFKLMYKQLGAYPEVLAYFIRHRICIIHLVRQNHLDVMLSYASKAKIGRSHLLVGQSAPDKLQVELDTKDLIRQLMWLERQQNLARGLLRFCKLPYLEVAYEDLLRDRNSYFRLIADFLYLDSPEQMPQSPLTRIRKKGHREVIANYDQVKQVLANSKFAGMLE